MNTGICEADLNQKHFRLRMDSNTLISGILLNVVTVVQVILTPHNATCLASIEDYAAAHTTEHLNVVS